MFDFPHHIRTRLCRAAFVAGCLLPTAGVALWAAWTNSPAHLEAARLRVESTVGTAVKLAAVRHPRPGTVHYHDLVLVDAAGRELLVVDRLEATDAASGTVLAAEGVEAKRGVVPRLQALLAERLARPGASGRITFSAPRLLLERDGELHDVAARWEAAPGGSTWTAAFRPEDRSSAPVLVRVGRSAEGRWEIELDTGEANVPCPLLALLCPDLERLGPAARFQGSFAAANCEEGWDGRVRGRLAGINLARLVELHSPHRVEGEGELWIESGRFRRGRIESLHATLTAGPGSISRSLVAAGVEWLQMTWGDPAALPLEMLPYDELAVGFSLDARGLVLEGRCRAGPADALAVRHGQLLLGVPRHQPQPVAGLVRVLAPSTDPLVPANRRAGWLLARLPLGESQ